MSLLVVGSIALDSVETPHGVGQGCAGGLGDVLLVRGQLLHAGPPGRRGRRGLPGRASRDAREPQDRHLGPDRREGGRDLPLAGQIPGRHEHGRDAGGPPQRPGHVRPRALAQVRRDAVRLPGQRQPGHAAQGALAGQEPQARRGRHHELLDRDPARRAVRAAPRGRRPGPQRRRGADAHRRDQPRPRRPEGARPRARSSSSSRRGARRDVPRAARRRS